ncbi:hypothetical protein [Nocardioides bruguierae]|uniref:Uncharacterized protein n=1 Tax=Nocardioides bruguierae TaxID=2945102 RepID=A0A9X2IG99_9ACTN|nr:hypothetical protein [Nocardioides bruguierae]MCL8027495.1 hypothetical protein [Nocardioides bruguierae]MCM0622671.1 hypothetical protein [Nocardioides bruguierae]
MFVHHCSACAKDQLIFPSMLSGVRTTDLGTEVTFECWCGSLQVAGAGHVLATA